MSHSNSTELDEIKADAANVAKVLKGLTDINHEDSFITEWKVTQNRNLIFSGNTPTAGTSATIVEIEVLMVDGVNIYELEHARSISLPDGVSVYGLYHQSTQIEGVSRELSRARITYYGTTINYNGTLVLEENG